MHNSRRFIITVLATLLTLTLSTNTSYGSSGSSWIPVLPEANAPTFHSVTFEDYLPLQFNYSVLSTSDQDGSMICKSTTDSACASMPLFQYNSIFKVCESSIDTDCIAKFNAVDESGNLLDTKFSNYTVTNHINAYPADAKYKIPAAGMPSIWNIPSLPHKDGTEFAIVAGENGEVEQGGTESAKLGRYIQVSVVPVVLKDFGKNGNTHSAGWNQAFIPGVYYDYCTTSEKVQGQRFMNCGHVIGDDCFLPTNEEGKCYQQVDYVGTPKFNIQLRLSKEPNGWIHGRIADPNVSISKDSTGNVNLSISATSTPVPKVYQGGLWENLPNNLQNFWVDCFKVNYLLCGMVNYGQGSNLDWNFLSRTLEGQSKINANVIPYSFGDRALNAMASISPLIGDKANATKTSWSFRTLTNNEMNGSNKCFTSRPGIKGIVSTNSTTYSAGPPELKDGYLQYKVSSAHFLPDGKTTFKGFYHLVMSSETARCIYGFSSAPISASIQVVSADGTTDVATTSTAEKNGWLYLSATGFTFSAPTIKVKLEQQPSAPVVSAPVAVNTTKITITCVKGKTTKKISGTSPKCPTGYTKRK